jgi:hypothetical protein
MRLPGLHINPAVTIASYDCGGLIGGAYRG